VSLTLKVPSIGESIREATVGAWKKAEGDWVETDEPLVEIESEKATLELPSPGAGRLKKILRRHGETVAIGEELAEIDDTAKPQGAGASGQGKKTNGGLPRPSASGAGASPGATAEGGAGASPGATAEGSAGASPGATAEGGGGAPVLRAPPSARRMMAESGIPAEDVRGTGRGGRIQPSDVVRALEVRKDESLNADGLNDRGVLRAPPGLPAAPSEVARERIVPMTPLRRTIARRLVEAQHTAAILTTFNEIDMSQVLALRERHQERFTKQYGVKLGFIGFFVKAAIEGLKAFPAVNAEIRGTDVVYKDHYDIGVAVGGGKGLVVPVIRAADGLSFAELEKTIAGLAAKAKDNKLLLSELEGGTFTISNGGVYGSMMSTPILNPPQSGILGLHAIQKRAVVVDNEVAVRPMMFVALSYDHRIVDGREAVQFLVRVKDCVETPERILLEI
jgi:2-oxoglutarate dehydrogenase E2 component (dihydrolipoamide succinyltransferase)